MIGRLLPPLLAVSGVVGVARVVPEQVERVTGKVRATLVQSELAEMAAAMERDAVAGLPLPTPGDQARLKTWLQANFQARQGRDPAVDLWQHPYRIVLTSDPACRRPRGCPAVVSDGADGVAQTDDDLWEVALLPAGADGAFRRTLP